MELFVSTLRFYYVIEALIFVQEVKLDKTKKLLYIFLYSCGFICLEKKSVQSYILQCVYTFIIIFLIDIKNEKKRVKIVGQISLLLLIYEFINLAGSILGVSVAMLLSNRFFVTQESAKIYAMVIKVLLVVSNLHYQRTDKKIVTITDRKSFFAFYAYFLVVCTKIPFLYTGIRDAFEWKVIFLTIICCTIIFLIISKIEKRNAEQEKARIEENNKILSTKLHKSREILPAMVQVLSNVTENNGIEMEQQEAYKLLQEVNDLYGQQLKENSKEDLQLKSFCSTGLKILDQQLNIYQREAVDKDVNFDIYVQAPINELLKRDDIDQLRLQRALGDLVRNAFRSTEREDKKCRAKGHILLIIGCRYEDILEISVVDNGLAFPLEVIEAFGKRGITTGGTGNGLADLVDFTKEIKASICLDEFDGRTNSFTKKISIIFDKKGINYFNSARKGKVTDPFWSTT